MHAQKYYCEELGGEIIYAKKTQDLFAVARNNDNNVDV